MLSVTAGAHRALRAWLDSKLPLVPASRWPNQISQPRRPGEAPMEARLVFGGGRSEGLDQVPSRTGLARPAVPLSTARLGGQALPSSKARLGQGAAGETVAGMTVGPPGLL